MSLISDYTQVLESKGRTTTYDLNMRDVHSEGYVSSTPLLYYELRINLVTEFAGLTEQCCKDYAGVNSVYFRHGPASAGTAKYFPSIVSRVVSFSSREAVRETRGFILTRTVETSIDIWVTALTGPTLSVASGKKTFPFNVVISKPSENVNVWYVVLPIYGVDATATLKISGAAETTVTISSPSIILVHGWDSNYNPSNPVFAKYI
jgi:hypothetical protein